MRNGDALHTPVILVLLEQFLLVEKLRGAYKNQKEQEDSAAISYPRIEPAHIAVRDASPVDDIVINHFLPSRRGLRLVYPSGLEPVTRWNKSKLHACTR
jgi:hypothetical protein